MSTIKNLEKMLSQGQDNALLRYGLGSAYFNQSDFKKAILHLKKTIELDPNYSAAWKLYGKALIELGELEQAKDIFTKGIHAANEKGDMQAVKEMQVFLRRIEKE